MLTLLTDARRTARDWRWGRRPLPPASVADTAQGPPEWAFPTGWARGRVAGVVRDGLQAGGLAPLLASQLSIHVEGRERVADAAGPLVFAPNHSSHLDAPLVLTALPPSVRRRTVTLAASDYFFDAWWRAAVTSLVFNAIPVERRGGGSAALPTERLEAGDHVLIFPEGTRSHDGYTRRFRPGAAHLACATGAGLVPVAIEGSWRAMPRGQGWPSSGRPRVRVSFGRPLYPTDGERAVALTERLEASIAMLVDEHRTDWWTAMHRQRRGTTPTTRGPDVADWRRRWALLADEVEDERGRPRRRTLPTRPRVWRRGSRP
jgi:1-acyl-sn-glycerol-3-phosphate acyltransferase